MSTMIRCTGEIHYNVNDTIFLYLYPIFGLIAFIGNLLVVIAIIINPVLRTKSNFLVAALAVTDLLVGAIVAPLTTVLIYFQEALPCSVIVTNHFVTAQLCASSVFLLAVISIDRYYHFEKLHAYYSFMSKKRIAIFIVTSFTLATICAFLFTTKISPLLYHVIVTVFFTIPVNIIIICYWKIFKIIRMKTRDIEEAGISDCVAVQSVHERHVSGAGIILKHVDNESPDGSEGRVQVLTPRIVDCSAADSQGNADSSRRPRKRVFLNTSRNWKVAKMMLIIVMAFSICWSPYVVLSLVRAARIHHGESVKRDAIVYKWTVFLGFLNSSINPIIYYISQRTLREGMLLVFGK